MREAQKTSASRNQSTTKPPPATKLENVKKRLRKTSKTVALSVPRAGGIRGAGAGCKRGI